MAHDFDDEDEDPTWVVDYAQDQTRYDADWLDANWEAIHQNPGDVLVGESEDGEYRIYARPDGVEYAVRDGVYAGPLTDDDEYDLSDLGLERAPNPPVRQPPAQRLDQWLQVRVSRKSYERIYSQIVLDIRDEHAEALADGRGVHARLVIARGYLSVAWALLTELRFVGDVIRALRGS